MIFIFQKINAQTPYNTLDYFCSENLTCQEGDWVAFATYIENTTGEKFIANWNFGDGEKLKNEEMQSLHEFRQQGKYKVKVNIKDKKGLIQTASCMITIKNAPPIINKIHYELIDPLKNIYRFTADVFDPSDDELSFTWDFGDGKTKSNNNTNTILHRYEDAQKYVVKLLVQDDEDEARAERLVYPSISKFDAKISGAYNGGFSGDVRPVIAGFLFATKKGCDWNFVLYDDERLMEMGFQVKDSQLDNLFQSEWLYPEGTGDGWFKKYTSRSEYLSVKSSMNLRNFPKAMLEGFGVTKPLPQSNIENQPDTVQELTRQKTKSEMGYDPTGETEFLKYSDEEGDTNYFGKLKSVSTSIRGNKRRKALEMRFGISLGNEDGEEVNIKGNVYLDIDEGQRLGILMADQCGLVDESEFEIYDHFPEPNVAQIDYNHPDIKVIFTGMVNPKTVNNETFQIGYLDKNGKLKLQPGRYMVSNDTISFIPNEPLMDGVQYQLSLIHI